MYLLICFISLYSIWASHAKPAVDSSKQNLLWLDHELWANRAFEFVHNLTCQDSFLTTEEDCQRLTVIQKSKMNFYSALANPGEKLMAVLPDGPLTRSGAHDGVVVLDPYPQANLGHLLVVFFIDLGWSELQCEVNGGQFIGNNVCMTLALRKRCHNMLQESKWKVKLLKQYRHKQCEINFFPLVYAAGEEPSQNLQRLECREDIQGFAPCPILRSLSHTNSFVCDPLKTNTRSCIVSGSGSDPTVNTRCRLFERCDHALLVTGGWNRLTDRPLYMQNMLRMHSVLRDNGFPDGNIKMFYSNGLTGLNEEEHSNVDVYPSALKLPLRYHLRKVCQSLHCADSLVIYLSGPTMNDGSMLLWDIDGNGQTDENEVYTVKELLYDIRDCAAQQVYLIADQSYSGMLIHALENSQRHLNVMAFSSGKDHEYSWNGEFTRHWRSFCSSLQNTDICVEQSFEAVKANMNSSSPLFYDGSNGTINTTFFGAPCNVKPPFSDFELRKHYFGCQNLPTSVWLRRRRISEDYDDE